MTRNRLFAALALLVVVGGVSACAGNATKPTAAANNVSGVHSYLCSDATSADLLQWTGSGTINGTGVEQQLTGSAPNESLDSQTFAITGTVKAGTAAVQFDGGDTIFGTVSRDTLVLNVPTDSGLQAGTCHRATRDDYNAAIASLSATVSHDNGAANAAQAFQQQAEAIGTAYDDVSHGLDALGGDVDTMSGDAQTASGDLDTLRGDEETMASDKQSGDDHDTICGDVQNLGGDAENEAGDAQNLEGDISSFDSDVRSLNHDVAGMGDALASVLSQQADFIGADGAPGPDDVRAMAAKARAKVAQFKARANGVITTVNQDVASSYAQANAANAANGCGSVSQPPAGVSPLH